MKGKVWRCNGCGEEFDSTSEFNSRPSNLKYGLCLGCDSWSSPGIYKHYKGGLYEVQSRAKHAETGEIMVVYWNLEHSTTWVRPLKEFLKPAGDCARFTKTSSLRQFEIS